MVETAPVAISVPAAAIVRPARDGAGGWLRPFGAVRRRRRIRPGGRDHPMAEGGRHGRSVQHARREPPDPGDPRPPGGRLIVERATDPRYLLEQYGTTDRLKIRIEINQLYSERTDDFLAWA